MLFNPDLNWAQKVIFSWKMTKLFHSQICFNIYTSAAIYLNEKLDLHLVYKKFPNQCNRLSAKCLFNNLPLYKASS